jgi:hypothetical protein
LLYQLAILQYEKHQPWDAARVHLLTKEVINGICIQARCSEQVRKNDQRHSAAAFHLNIPFRLNLDVDLSFDGSALGVE